MRRESSPGLPELTMVYWGPCLEAPTIISPPEVRQKTILNLPFLAIGQDCRLILFGENIFYWEVYFFERKANLGDLLSSVLVSI